MYNGGMDTNTLPLPLEAEVKRAPGRPAKYASAAERQAAYRARKSKAQVAVMLDQDVAEALDQYMRRQSMDGAALTKSQVIQKLIQNQLLRKR